MYGQFLVLASSSLVASSILPSFLQSFSKPQALISSKPVVSSKALQDDITVAALLKRAKHFSKLADTSFEEYNHPTRVIGSEGNSISPSLLS